MHRVFPKNLLISSKIFKRSADAGSLMNRRRAIIGMLGLGSLFLGGKILLSSGRENDRNIPNNQSLEDLVKRFSGFPDSVQSQILGDLRGYVLSQTEIGAQIQSAFSSIDVPEVVDTSLPQGRFEYLPYSNEIMYCVSSNNLQIRQYLQGVPILFGEAHEHLHAIQDRESKWDRFENFFRDFVPESHAATLEIIFPAKKVREFSLYWLNKPSASDQEAINGFLGLWNQYISAWAERKVIYEVQAYLAFEPYTNAQGLYQRIMTAQQAVSEVRRDLFNDVFELTIELYGLVDPVQAAIFAGRNADSLQAYKSAIERLKFEYGVSDAYSRGLGRQHRLQKEVQGIAYRAKRIILDHQ